MKKAKPPVNPDSDTPAISTRVSRDLHDRIEAAAKADRRKKAAIVAHCIGGYLPIIEKRVLPDEVWTSPEQLEVLRIVERWLGCEGESRFQTQSGRAKLQAFWRMVLPPVKKADSEIGGA